MRHVFEKTDFRGTASMPIRNVVRSGTLPWAALALLGLLLSGCPQPDGNSPAAATTGINAASVSGLIAPATGAAPVTKEALSPGAATYTVQSLSWTPTVSGTFAGGVSYTASIVLKAAAGYKFTGAITPSTGGAGTPSAGTIHGGDTAENTLSFTVSFPATAGSPAAATPIGSASVSGLTAPVTGNTPVAPGALSAGDTSYTVQSLSWTPTVSGTFAGGVSYTASIVLKAAAGYKFTGAITPTTGGAGTPSAGTIHGGDAAENTLSFTVSFPATAGSPAAATPIGSASVSGLAAPVTGNTPVAPGALSAGDTSYTVQSLSWTPTVSGTFAGGVSYTASIVLKAAAGYKFTGAITPSTGGAGTPSAGTIHGGDAAENTVSFTVSFPATEPVPNTGIPIGDPSVGLFLDGGSTPRAHNGTTTIAVGTGAFAVSIAPGAYASIVWYLNGTKAAEGPEKTSISLSRWTAKSYLVTVEAQPLGGEKNSGAHTFVVQ